MKKTAAMLITAAIAAILSSGCTKTNVENAFYPLVKDSEWTYETTVKRNGSETKMQTQARVAGNENINGVNCRTVVYTANASSEVIKKEYYKADTEDITLIATMYKGAEIECKPPHLVLPAENSDRKEWRWTGTSLYGHANAVFNQSKADIITAGPFKDLVTTRVDAITITDDRTVIKESKWFALDKGLVKSTAVIEENGKPTVETATEITEFSISGKKGGK